MAQFDVYPNPNPASRERVPFVVNVQSDLLEQLPSRLVMPLSRVGLGKGAPRRLARTFEVKGENLALMAHLAAPVDARLLKKAVASLAAERHEFADAMDAVLSGI
jgi:toxin CcdB